MSRLSDITEALRNVIIATSYPTITKSTFNEVTAVDDASAEDPAMVMADYSEILSIRVSYGTNEIYDIFVAKVK